jgi:multicomponent Na+:H+ antiporter subunit E
MKTIASPVRKASGGPGLPRRHAPRALAAGATIFAFWLVISASLEPADLLLGAVLSALLGLWSVQFLWAGEAPRVSLRQLFALLCYLLAFSVAVFRSAVHVARVVVDPRLPIRPRLITCRTGLRREISRVAFAHSVSLTPGTLTVDMDDGTFLVHCLDEQSAARILSGELERQVARVFERGDDA